MTAGIETIEIAAIVKGAQMRTDTLDIPARVAEFTAARRARTRRAPAA